jgi:outer membrane lipoprotein-sorting protein
MKAWSGWILGIFLGALAMVRAPAQVVPSAEEILARSDRNAVSETRIVLAEMTIRGRRESRTIKFKSWVRGKDKAFTEYLDPPREKGIKMLKLGERLWTYSPDTDRAISISGHMLRQSVMGSDFSYEDMMENRELHEVYRPKIAGEENVLERPCWVLELTSKVEDAAYDRRKIWVDKERYVLLKEERYAKSGKLLKSLEVKSVIRIEGRWAQNDLVFKDALKEGQGTEFKIESVEFNATIPEELFTKASLRK